ncbi:actin-related protein T2-like [Protobothrops mucrosquamatus]|uniref:actin-related protein T2-like n=1 Tax=Protobothrops mucrosquamatus TaxID=103944 RepID=UPI00077578FD|nr:actin-related protein T2-like [Protobothrops mucrosquamatus]
MGREGFASKTRISSSQAVIIDNGSGMCKSGISGEISPRHVMATVLGCPRSKLPVSKAKQKECYVGFEAQHRQDVLSLTYPMEAGVITSWDEMETIWKYIYDKGLGVKAFERPLLMTESPLNPKEDRAKLTQLMFEYFKVPAFYLSIQAILSLYASARYMGMVIDCGFGVSHAVPVYEGYCLPHAVTQLGLGGRDITHFLRELLLENRQYFWNFPEANTVVEDIKVKLCFVTLDARHRESKSSEELPKEYKLPDGNRVKIGDPLYLAPEILFTPSNINHKGQGLHKLVAHSVRKCDPTLRNVLYSNVLISGGSSLFPGLDERMFKGLEGEAPQGVPIKVIAPPDRWFSAWIGASIITSLSTFKQMWVTAADYREYGPNIVHRRCY